MPTYFVARNFSNASAALRRSRMRCFWSFGRWAPGRPRPWTGSSAAPRCPGCACTRRRSCGSRRRAARRAGRRARIFSLPATPPVRNSRSRSQIVSPYVGGSSSTGMTGSFQCSGSRSAMRWPRTRWTRISVATCICFCSIASSLVDRVHVGAPLDRLVGHVEGHGRCRRRSRARRAAARAPASGTARSRRPG